MALLLALNQAKRGFDSHRVHHEKKESKQILHQGENLGGKDLCTQGDNKKWDTRALRDL